MERVAVQLHLGHRRKGGPTVSKVWSTVQSTENLHTLLTVVTTFAAVAKVELYCNAMSIVFCTVRSARLWYARLN